MAIANSSFYNCWYRRHLTAHVKCQTFVSKGAWEAWSMDSALCTWLICTFVGQRFIEWMAHYPNHSQFKFILRVTGVKTLLKLTWLTSAPVWVDQWPLKGDKLIQAHKLIQEQLQQGHIVTSTSPWNTPIFVIPKSQKNGDYCRIYKR